MWVASDPLLRGYVICVLCAVALAGVILPGSDDRFQGANWEVLNRLGGHLVWGSMFVIMAVALLVAPRISLAAVHWTLHFCAKVHLLFAICFGLAAITTRTTPGTGAVAYTAIALWHISMSESYRRFPT